MSKTYNQYPNTIFPDAIQPLPLYEDLTEADANNYQGYLNAVRMGQWSTARNYLSQITNIGNKALTAEKMNTMLDTISALQQYSINFENVLEQFQGDWEELLNAFSYKGTWNSSTNYLKNNMVSYANSTTGQDTTKYLYIALQDNQNINPYTDYENNDTPTNWYRLTIKGKQGNSGASADSVSYAGNWNNNNEYNVNDIVSYNNAWWIANSSNTNTTPSSTSSTWTMLFELPIIPVQLTQPTSQPVGSLWFQTL